MTIKNKEYWVERARQRNRSTDEASESLNKKVKRTYEESLRGVEGKISALYGRFADSAEFPYEKAKEIIKGSEYSKWRKDIQGYVDEINKLSGLEKSKLQLELDTLAYRSRITRLEALKAEIKASAALTGAQVERQMAKGLGDQLELEYYKNLFEISKEAGVIAAPLAVKITKDSVEDAIKTPWFGRNFSTSIWNNTDNLCEDLANITGAFVEQGKSLKELSRHITKRYNVEYSAAKRLVHSEMAYVSEKSDLMTYRNLEIEEYVIVTVPDDRRSEICRSKEGLRFKVAEAQQGENFPPFHAYCRTRTRAGTSEAVAMKDLAEKESGTLVEKDMDYKKWEEIYARQENVIDITNEWRKLESPRKPNVKDLTSYVVDGVAYNVGGTSVVLDYSKREKEVAEILDSIYGKDVYMVPRVNFPQGVKTPDYIINGEAFDLKEIKKESMGTIKNALGRSKGQAKHFIVDLGDSSLSAVDIKKRVSIVYELKRTSFVDIIIVLKNNEVFKAYKRNK